MNKRRTFSLTIAHYKILETVYLLNEQSIYPTSLGVEKILSGIEDKETIPYSNFSSYGTLISFSNKKVSRYIMMLTRYKYLTKRLNVDDQNLYIAITNLGVTSLVKFKEKHPNIFKKKEGKQNPNFVKIEE